MLGNNCPKYLITDKECVLRAQKGEYDVLRVLYERYYPEVLSYANLKISDDADAQEIVSQVFAYIVENINTVEKADCFRSWLFTIVNHKIFYYYRKKKINKTDLVADLPEPVNEDGNEPIDILVVEKPPNSLIQNVKTIMRLLSPIEQRVLYLSNDWGYNNAEIGKIIGKSEEAVKKMAQRAKKKFRELYLQKFNSPIYLGGEKND